MSQPLTQLHERNFAFEARALDHLKRTHCPEDLAGLDWSHAPRNRPFKIIRPFRLDPTRRPDRAMAPCPLCSPKKPKYYDGALVWFPTEGVYRCIGAECAAHYIGKAEAERAKKEFKLTQARNSDFEFLFSNLGHVPAMTRYFEAILPAARHAEKLRNRLGIAHVREPLRKMYKNNGGQLVVWRAHKVSRVDLRTSEQREQTERIRHSFGKISGWCALAGSFDIPRKIQTELSNLRVLDRGEQDEAERWVYENAYQFPEDMRVACLRLREANALQSRAVASIADVLAFFSSENFERIRQFGRDPDAAFEVYASMKGAEFRIGPTMSDCATIKPDFQILTALPSWPQFERPGGNS